MQSDKIFGCFKLLTDIDVSIKPSISSETKHFIEEEKLFFSLSYVIATSTYMEEIGMMETKIHIKS